MATPDPLKAVSPDVAARTKALLEAVASGGSQGLRSYEQSQGALNDAKTAAITRAQQRANLMGGPEAQGFEAAAAGQFDRRIADVGNARTGFESRMAALGGAHKNYLDQVNAAVPLVRADTQRQLTLQQDALNAKAASENDDKYMESDALGAAEMTQSQAKEALAAAQADAMKYTDQYGALEHTIKNANDTEAAILKQMRGYGNDIDTARFHGEKVDGTDVAKKQAGLSKGLDEARAARAGAQKSLDGMKGSSIIKDLEKRNAELQTTVDRPLHEIARDIAVRGGVDRTRAAGLIGPEATLARSKVQNDSASVDVRNVAKWGDTDVPTAQTLLTLPDYSDGRTVGYGGLTAEVDDKGMIDGQTPWELFLEGISDLITGDEADTTAYKALVNEFQPMYVAAGRNKSKKK